MLRAGDFVGRYQIERRLGHGGMGTLYVAHDPVLDRQIALKLLLGDIDLPGARERFVREARAAAALSNPNIVTIYDYGDYASQPYIVMEYIQGETLAELIRRKADIPVAVKLRWTEELCTAVGYAHARGIIHRDIKPPNLMIDSYGRLKVLDFGIARMRGTLVTNATALIGTPGYCAPEQIRGGQIDHRSDLFSIAVVCYELLAFTEAFHGETVHAITHRILNDDPDPLSQVYPGVDGELEAVLMKALQKPPDLRYSSADALREAVAAVRSRLETDSEVTTFRYMSPAAQSSARPTPTVASSAQPTPGADAGRENVKAPAGTPSSDPRRTDRDIAARLRVAQIQEHLRTARKHLAADDLPQALAACEQALKLDDAHPEARELIAAVNTAREQVVKRWVGEARAGLTRGDTKAAEEMIGRVQAVQPAHPETANLTRELRLLRVDQDRAKRRAQAFTDAIATAEAALERNDFDQALDRAREALEIDPTSVRARLLQDEALQGEEVRTRLGPDIALDPTVVRVPSPSPQVAVQAVASPVAVRPTASPVARPARGARIAALLGAWRALRREQQYAVIGGVVVVVLAAAIGAVLLTRPAPPPPSLVVLDAVPWATITAVQRQSGEREPLPAPASTPLALRLSPGTYRVTLQGPPPQSEQRTINLEIKAGAPASFPLQRFSPVNVDDYFRPFLTPPAAPAVPEPPAPSQEVSQ